MNWIRRANCLNVEVYLTNKPKTYKFTLWAQNYSGNCVADRFNYATYIAALRKSNRSLSVELIRHRDFLKKEDLKLVHTLCL